jgi:hypothetical protein
MNAKDRGFYQSSKYIHASATVSSGAMERIKTLQTCLMVVILGIIMN